MKHLLSLTAKIFLVIFVLGISPSCEKEDPVVPTTKEYITVTDTVHTTSIQTLTDTVYSSTIETLVETIHTSDTVFPTCLHPNITSEYNLGVITPDTTLTQYTGIDIYAMQNTYSISLSDIYTEYNIIADDIQSIEISDKSSSPFFSTNYSQPSGGILIDLICSKSSYTTNEHIIVTSITTSDQVHVITLKFDLLHTATHEVYSSLINSLTLSSSSNTTWNSTSTQPYNSDIDQYNTTFFSSFALDATVNPKYPAIVDLGSLSLYESESIIIIISTNNIVHLLTGTTIKSATHTLTSAANGKGYLSGTNGLDYITF